MRQHILYIFINLSNCSSCYSAGNVGTAALLFDTSV